MNPTKNAHNSLNEWLVGLLLAMLALAWLASLYQITPGPLSWIMLRVSGTVAYLGLAVATALGPLLSSRYAPRWLQRATQYGWHGLLAGFSLLASLLHGLFMLVEKTYPQGLAGVLVPGLSTYKPLEIGLGSLALYGLALVYCSTMFRQRLGNRAWRWLHLTAYPAFGLATLHGLGSGSDPLQGLYLASLLVVGATLLLRLSDPKRSPTA